VESSGPEASGRFALQHYTPRQRQTKLTAVASPGQPGQTVEMLWLAEG
jgi:hypothetical protein